VVLELTTLVMEFHVKVRAVSQKEVNAQVTLRGAGLRRTCNRNHFELRTP